MVDQETMAAYATHVERYRKLVKSQGGNRRLAGFIARFHPGDAVLDLGCGVGDSAARMRDAGLEVSCMDASPDMAAMARELHGIEVRQMGFDQLADDALYDGVWASFSLLHAPRADMPANLARIHRALKADGILYIGLKTGGHEERDAAGRFYAYFGEEELRDHLGVAGFTILEVETDSITGMLGTPEPCIHITAKRG